MRSELQCGRLKNQAAMFSSDPGGRTFKWKYPRAEEVHRPPRDVPLGKENSSGRGYVNPEAWQPAVPWWMAEILSVY